MSLASSSDVVGVSGVEVWVELVTSLGLEVCTSGVWRTWSYMASKSSTLRLRLRKSEDYI
jgi:hypothetical protein